MAYRKLSLFLSSLIVWGCSEEPDALDAGPDIGVDAGSIDAGPVVEDGGVLDSGFLDAGIVEPVRRLVTHRLVPESDSANLMLLPDFESRVINGGWLALPVMGGAPIPWTLEHRTDVPSDRPQVAVIEGAQSFGGGTNFIGFGMAAELPFTASLWLGSTAEEPAWSSVIVALLGFVDGMGASVLQLVPEPESDTELGGVTWRRYRLDNLQDLIGRITVLVQNRSPDQVYVNAPFLGVRLGIGDSTPVRPRPIPEALRLQLGPSVLPFR